MHPNAKHVVKRGERFGRLRTIRETRKRGRRAALCVCNCGNEKIVALNDLLSGDTRSCGCLFKEGNHVSHRLTKHPLYKVWSNMKRRCHVKSHEKYKYYGGRGIKMCRLWRNNPEQFIRWALKKGWKRGLEIDRRNNDGDYKPSNCRVVTHTVNGNNTRANVHVTYRGRQYTVSQLARKFRVKRRYVEYRLLDKRMTATQIAKEAGVR